MKKKNKNTENLLILPNSEEKYIESDICVVLSNRK